MFWTIMGFMFLGLFGFVVTGGVILGRRMLTLLSLRGQVETEKTKAQLDGIKHNRAVDNHQKQLQLLALTAGPSQEKPVSNVVTEDVAEEVKLGKKDISSPSGFDNIGEARAHYQDQLRAEDAEVTEVPIIA